MAKTSKINTFAFLKSELSSKKDLDEIFKLKKNLKFKKPAFVHLKIAPPCTINFMTDSGNFPRVTYCDLDVRILGTVQKHTVQCVLIINIFTEKVFILLWIWYTFLMAFSIFSLFNWLLRMLPKEARTSFIARRLELADIGFRRELYAEELDEFVQSYIKMDGVFVLRMLTIHAGVLACTEVVDNLWEEFRMLTAKPKDEAEEQSHEQETRPRDTSPQSSCPTRQQALLPRQRNKTPVLAPLMTRHDPYFHSQFHGGTEPMASGGAACLGIGGRGGCRGAGSRMAVHRPSSTSLTPGRFNLRPIGLPSKFSVVGAGPRRDSTASTNETGAGGTVRHDFPGSQHNLTAQLHLSASTTVPSIAVNEVSYNGTEEQYLQGSAEQENLLEENEL